MHTVRLSLAVPCSQSISAAHNVRGFQSERRPTLRYFPRGELRASQPLRFHVVFICPECLPGHFPRVTQLQRPGPH